MSASETSPGPTPSDRPAVPQPSAGATPTADPSMEDILASIRRILSEDEAPPADSAASPGSHPGAGSGAQPARDAEEPSGSGVLVLDPGMMVSEPPAHEAAPQPPEPEATPEPPEPEAPPPPALPATPPSLVAPEAAAAAASTLGSLMRALAADRGMQVRSGGPTIEDIVREELRPLLKAWLDTNLPALVERLVRAEIDRVVRRAVP